MIYPINSKKGLAFLALVIYKMVLIDVKAESIDPKAKSPQFSVLGTLKSIENQITPQIFGVSAEGCNHFGKNVKVTAAGIKCDDCRGKV